MRSLTVKTTCCKASSDSWHHCPLPNTIKKPIAERCEILRDDVRRIRNERSSSLTNIDTTVREIFKKESDLHKKVADKWFSLVANDIELCKQLISKYQFPPHNVETDDEVEIDDGAYEQQSPPPAAEAYYEPWVIDD